MDQRIIYIGSIREYLELGEKKSKDPGKYKKIEIVYDLNKIRKERNEMTNKINDEKRFTKEEAKVNKYMAEHKGVSYREAVLACLDKSEGLPESKEEKFGTLTKDEILRTKRSIDNIVYELSQAKDSDAFNESDQKLLDEAYLKVQEVAKNLQVIVDKQD